MAIPDLSFSRAAHLEGRPTLGISGDLGAPILIMSDYPSSVDIREGQHLNGTERVPFNMIMTSAHLDRLDLAITTLVKNPISLREQKAIAKEGYFSPTIQESLHTALETIKKSAAHYIIAYGELNLVAFSKGKFSSIDKYQGSIYSFKELGWDIPDKYIMFMYHPRTHRMSDSPMTIYYSYANMKKLQMFMDMDKKQFPPKAIVHVLTQPCEVFTYLDIIEQRSLFSAVDIETTGGQTSCIGMSLSHEEAIVIPFLGPKGNYWSERDEIRIWHRIAQFMQSKTGKIFQNGYFDMMWLYRELGIITRNFCFDTMVFAHAFWTDLPKGLDALTNVYTLHRYYKDDGRTWRLKKNWDFQGGWRYNGMDCICTHSIALKQIEEASNNTNNIPFFHESMRAHKPLMEMAYRGLRVDRVEKDKVEAEAIERLRFLESSINDIVGQPINARSSKAVMDYLYGTLGLTPYTNRKTKKPTCDTKALTRIQIKGKKGSLFATLVLEYRALHKLVSSYFRAPLLDGRLVNDYKITGTKSGRLSSTKTIEGYGTNMQNQPKEMKKFLIADPGMLLFEVDLATAENWVVAFTAEDLAMIDILLSGGDVHTMNAARIFNITPEAVTKDLRAKGKKVNHAANYCMGPNTMSLQTGLPIPICKQMLDGYFRVFHAVKRYQEDIDLMVRRSRTVTNLFGWSKKFLGPMSDSLSRSAVSFIPQSTVGRYLVKGATDIADDRTLDAVPLNATVHDSLLGQVPIAEGVANLWDVLSKIQTHLTIPITVHGRTFSIPCDVKIGLSWASMEEIKPLTESNVRRAWETLLHGIQQGKHYGQNHESWVIGSRLISSTPSTQSVPLPITSGVASVLSPQP